MSVDDFGVGYSSLSRLLTVEVDGLGVDIGQGYIIAQPMPPEQLYRFLEQARADRDAADHYAAPV